MLKYFITSKTKRSVLRLFLSNTDSAFYTREIARLLSEPLNAVRRELGYLEKAGLLRSHLQGNLKYYAVVPDYPCLCEWQKIVLSTPDEPTRKPLTEQCAEMPRIAAMNEAAVQPSSSEHGIRGTWSIHTMDNLVTYLTSKFLDLNPIYLSVIHGKAARMEVVPEDGIDLLVVGDISKDDLLAAVAQMEDEAGVPIRLLHISHSDFNYRNARGDPVIRRIWSEKKLVVKGRHQPRS